MSDLWNENWLSTYFIETLFSGSLTGIDVGISVNKRELVLKNN